MVIYNVIQLIRAPIKRYVIYLLLHNLYRENDFLLLVRGTLSRTNNKSVTGTDISERGNKFKVTFAC